MVKLLLKAGADPNKVDGYREIPSMWLSIMAAQMWSDFFLMQEENLIRQMQK